MAASSLGLLYMHFSHLRCSQCSLAVQHLRGVVGQQDMSGVAGETVACEALA